MHCSLNESRVRNFQQRRHCNGARLPQPTAHCGLKESRIRNFQQRRHCNGAHLALHTVHYGLKESRAHFQQQRQFNGAHLVLYHRHRIMAEHYTNNIQATLKFCPRFDGKDKAYFFYYKDKLCVVLSFHRQGVAVILQGDPKSPAAQNSTAVATWERVNENLFSILFFTTERSANNVVKKHMGKTREDGIGNGQAAWNALEEKYNGHTKEARRAYHEKLHNSKKRSGDDPDNFLYIMDSFRERLEDMGQPVPDERYEDIILQALPAEYERVRTAIYKRRDFHLSDIRRMMSALCIDCLSRPNNSPLITGRGVAMQATGGDDSSIKCHHCGNPVHLQKNCVAWIAAQCKNGNL